MVPIKQNLVSPSKYNIKCPYTMDAEGITVHNTSNKAPAKNEISYMISNNKQVSFHYAVDDVEIIQGIPENRNAFHAGDGNGKGNRKTIGIEICYSTGDKAKFEKAQENAAEFIAYKLKEKGWGTDRVYPHKHWSGKHCPHRTLDEYGWDYFISLVNKYLNGATPIQPTIKTDIIYQTWDDVKNTWLPNVTNDSDYAGLFGDDVCAVYANLSTGSCTYKVHTQNGKWLPAVKDRSDYAGIFNKPIDAFMIKSNDPNVVIHYQAHTRGGKWLPYVTGYSESDDINGYAGVIGKPIDGIRMYVEVKQSNSQVVVTPTQPVTPVETEKPKEEIKEDVKVEPTPTPKPEVEVQPEIPTPQPEEPSTPVESMPETEVKNEEIPTPQPDVVEPEKPQDDKQDINTDKISKLFEIIIKIVKYIIGMFKK